MKQIISLILILSLSLGFYACSRTTKQRFKKQYELGVRYLNEGNYKEAIIAFNEAVKIDPKSAPAYIGLADAYIGIGDTENALKNYETAVVLGENTPEVFIKLADIYVEKGDVEKAIEVLQQGYKASGDASLVEKAEEIQLAMKDISDVATNFYIIDYAKAMWCLKLEEGEEYLPTVYLNDTDSDGKLDLITPDIGFGIGRMSPGDSRIGIRFDAHGGAAGSLVLVYNKSSDTFAFLYNYATVGIVVDEIKLLRGLLWRHESAMKHSDFFFENPINTYYLNGVEVTEDKYLQFTHGYEYDSAESDNSKLLNHLVKCSKIQMHTVLDAYGEYAKKQEGFVGWEVCNLNGDDITDAVYVFSGCCRSDFSNSEAYQLEDIYNSPQQSQGLCLFPKAYKNGLLKRPIIVVAESNENGILFKTTGLENQFDISSYKFKDNILILSNDSVKKSYTYSSKINTFSSNIFTAIDVAD